MTKEVGVLGRLKSAFVFPELAKTGVPRVSIDKLSDYMGIIKKVFSNPILHVSASTLERKEPQEKLDLYTSSIMVEVARVMEHAYEVIQDQDKVKNWLQRPNRYSTAGSSYSDGKNRLLI